MIKTQLAMNDIFDNSSHKRDAEVVEQEFSKELKHFTEEDERRLAQMRVSALNSAANNKRQSPFFSIGRAFSEWFLRPLVASSALASLLLIGLFILNPASDLKGVDTLAIASAEDSTWLVDADSETLAIAQFDLAFYEFVEASL